MASMIASSQSITNTASSTSLSPSLANLNGLSTPKPAQQRRMTTSALPPPTSLNLPEPVYGHPGHSPGSPRRPPSPLRNEFTHRRLSNDSHSGDDDDEDDDSAWPRSRSPGSSSVTQSRREAELILTREAEERRAMEERILAMMNSSPQSLPPPRSRSQTLPNPPSPAQSQKEGTPSWWSAAKARLTPTKEPLTPAQQVIEEAKAREKENKSAKGKDNEWPASSAVKYTDPAYLNLKIPSGRPPPRTSSPTSPTPVRTPINLSPAPVPAAINLSPVSLQRGTSPGGTPSREAPPLYASFTPSGTLDVPGTLLLIAKRFEKLEKWSVSHVRALEERMGDVERWLVDKENHRSKETGSSSNDKHSPEPELAAIRGDVTELQSRMSELGREMARLATAPAILSSNTAIRDSPVMNTAPPTESSIISPHHSGFSSGTDTRASEISSSNTTSALGNIRSLSTPRRVPSLTARESTSPPLARVSSTRTPSGIRTRLPYPTGDYTSPGDLISPTHTPANSPPQSARSASMVISGLPVLSSPLELPTATSSPRALSPTPTGLPAPRIHSPRGGSVSPTPMQGGRKRYTVALGGPIVAPTEVESEYERERSGLATAFFSSTGESSDDYDDYDDESVADANETFGKKAASRAAAAKLGGGGSASTAVTHDSPGGRVRAQSTYGGFANALQSNQALSAESKHRFRSQSIDVRSDSTFGGEQIGKFVDPLVLRRQGKSEKGKGKPLVGPGKKVPVGQLVAFFDSERK
ncbi:hypothetical protein AZE42_04014 [Rhizopogon vesiculosus]|uniref:Uncharacterized protein n=1 Tax=Rhizopogon vesiculosus TaxID=180088 RepID=A0A1J8QF35_9AGAM|nr:hypothetical protein AZE42_04014 [Rhizopogon vesiculosus]